MDVKLVHFSNAQSGIDFKVSGRLISFNLGQLPKQALANALLPVNTTFSKESQP
jgi:hypothetical protein